MAADAVCPGCGAPLGCSTVAGARRYVCGSCGSEVVGLAVLNRLLPDGEAHRLWTSARPAADGPSGSGGEGAGNRCPFCSTPMCDAPLSPGHIGVCRRCQMVWLTKEAMEHLPGAGDGPRFVPAAITRCQNCGAPLKDSPDGSCSYCGYQVVAPQVVVVADGHQWGHEQAESGRAGWGAARTASSIAGTLIDLLVDPLQ